MRIFFATWMDENFGQILNNKDAKNRLVSYFFIKEQKVSPVNFKRYIKKGVTKKIEK